MKLTKIGQFVEVDTSNIGAILEFDNGDFILQVTDDQYNEVLTYLKSTITTPPTEEIEEETEESRGSFYVNPVFNEATVEEDGVGQV